MSKSLNQFRQKGLPELFPNDNVSQNVSEGASEKVHSAQVTKQIENEKADKVHDHDDTYALLTDFNALTLNVNELEVTSKTTVVMNPPSNTVINRVSRLTIVSYDTTTPTSLVLGTGYSDGDMVHVYRDHDTSGAFTITSARMIRAIMGGNVIKEASHHWEGKSMAILVYSDNEWLLSLS